MPAFARMSNAYKKSSMYTRVSGAYKAAYQVYARVSGVWKPIWSYVWETGAWGTCSKTCGGGVQTRTAKCKRNDGGYVADNFCTKYGLAKPSVSQACNTHSCETYSWFVIPQGCSTGCGSGQNTYTVECHRDSDFLEVDSSYCPKPVPPEFSGSCKDCSTCIYVETDYLKAKVKHCNAIRFEGRSNWTTAQVRSYCIKYDGTVRAHYDRYHTSEKVCAYQSTYCCKQAGYTYYSGTKA